MLTIQPNVSVVQLTALEPGELFQCPEGQGSYVAMLVENEAPRYVSWLHLSGKHQFRMENTGTGGSLHYAQAPKVLRLGIDRKNLHVQIDQTRIARAGAAAALSVGFLHIDDQLRIVTIFGGGNAVPDELSGVSLVDLSREYVDPHRGYVCNKWQLIHIPQGLPPEVIAESSPTEAASVEPLRI